MAAHGIHNVSVVNGTQRPDVRAKIIQEFVTTNEPHILILSNVGTTGLNLFCSDILILLVCTVTATLALSC